MSRNLSACLRSIPAPGQKARFAPGFGQRSLLTVDTEEEFDWEGDFSSSDHGLKHLKSIAEFQQFAENIGVVPTYLIDWPIASSGRAQEMLGEYVRRGTAEIGIQLHPWVNPPFEEDVNPYNSYAGNLPHALEREKFLRLQERIIERFNCTPPSNARSPSGTVDSDRLAIVSSLHLATESATLLAEPAPCLSYPPVS